MSVPFEPVPDNPKRTEPVPAELAIIITMKDHLKKMYSEAAYGDDFEHGWTNAVAEMQRLLETLEAAMKMRVI